jgi:hypothetical protein
MSIINPEQNLILKSFERFSVTIEKLFNIEIVKNKTTAVFSYSQDVCEGEQPDIELRVSFVFESNCNILQHFNEFQRTLSIEMAYNPINNVFIGQIVLPHAIEEADYYLSSLDGFYPYVVYDPNGSNWKMISEEEYDNYTGPKL